MIFRKPGYEHINIPFAKPIKKHYVKKVFRDLWRGIDRLALQTKIIWDYFFISVRGAFIKGQPLRNRSIKWYKTAKTKNTT